MKIFTMAHLAISLAGILSGFVLLVLQSFFYVPVLKAIAPTPNESPFKLAQLSDLLTFIIARFFAVSFRTGPLPLALQSNPEQRPEPNRLRIQSNQQ